MRGWLFVNKDDRRLKWTIEHKKEYEGFYIRSMFVDIIDAIINGEGPYLARVESNSYDYEPTWRTVLVNDLSLRWMHDISPAVIRTFFRFIIATTFRELCRGHPFLNEEMAKIINTMIAALDGHITIEDACKKINELNIRISSKYLRRFDIHWDNPGYSSYLLNYNGYYEIIRSNVYSIFFVKSFMFNRHVSPYGKMFMQKILLEEIISLPDIPPVSSW